MIGKTNAAFVAKPIAKRYFRDALTGDYRFNKNDNITGQNRNSDFAYSGLSLQACSYDNTKSGGAEIQRYTPIQQIDHTTIMKTIKGTKTFTYGSDSITKVFPCGGLYLHDGFFIIPNLAQYITDNGFRISWGGVFEYRDGNRAVGSGAFCLGTAFTPITDRTCPAYGAAAGSSDIFSFTHQQKAGDGNPYIYIDGQESEYINPLTAGVYYEYELMWNSNGTITATIYQPELNITYTYTTTNTYAPTDVKTLIIGCGSNNDNNYGRYLLEYLAIYNRVAAADLGTTASSLWTHRTTNGGTAHGSFNKDEGDQYITQAAYDQTYVNVAYAPSNLTNADNEVAYNQEKRSGSDSRAKSRIKLQYGSSVLVYDGITPAKVPMAYHFNGSDHNFGWNYNNFGTYYMALNDSSIANGFSLGLNPWTGKDKRTDGFNVQWLLLSGATITTDGTFSSTQTINGYMRVNSDNHYGVANLITYSGPKNNGSVIDTCESTDYQLSFDFAVGYEKNNYTTYSNEQVNTRTIYIFNTRMADYIRQREYNTMSNRTQEHYVTTTYNDYVATMQTLNDTTPTSYFANASSNDLAESNLRTTFYNAVTDYQNKVDAAIAAKAHLCKCYEISES